MMIKHLKLAELNTNIESRKYANGKNDIIEYKCLICNKNHQKKCDEALKKGFFFNTYKFSNHGIKKFIFLL